MKTLHQINKNWLRNTHPRAFGAGVCVTGFSTIEILIAFAVGIIFLSAAIMVAFSGQQSLSNFSSGVYHGTSTDTGQAVALDVALDNYALATSSNRIRKIVALLTKNWNSFPADDSEIVNTTLTYGNTSSIMDISPCLKQITSTTTWSSLNNRNHHITFGTALGSMDIATAYGRGGCDPLPPGDWDNPTDTGWGITPSQMSGSGSDIAVTTIQGTNYAFITTWQNSNPSNPDLWPVDVSNPTNPTLLTALNSGKGLNGIAIEGTYAYVIQNDSTNQLQVIDISNPTNLSASSIKISVTLPNMTTAIAPSSIAYYNGYIYIGTPYVAFGTTIQNHELHVYCVHDPSVLNCSPETPKWMGSFNVNHNVNDIAIQQRVVGGVMKTFAFFATSDSTGGYPELTILDVTAPSTNITLAGSKNLPGNLYGTSVYVLGNRVYLGRQRATGSNYDLYVLDISNSIFSPSILKQKKLGLNPNTAITNIIIHGNIAFILTSDSTAPVQIWDVISHATDIIAVSTCAHTINLSVSTGLAYKDDLVYVVNKNQAAMNIIHDQTTTCN